MVYEQKFELKHVCLGYAIFIARALNQLVLLAEATGRETRKNIPKFCS